MKQNHRNSTPESRASSSGKSIASRNSSTDMTSTHNLTPTDWDSKSLSPSQTYHTSSLHTEPCVPNYNIFPEFMSSIHRHGKDSPSLGYISEFEALSPTGLPAGSHHIDLLNIPGNIPNSIEIGAEEPSSKDIPVMETDTKSNAGHGPYAADSHLRNQSGTVSRPRSDVSKVPVILDDNQGIAAAYQSTALKQSSCPILKSQTQPASYSQVYRDHSTYFAPGVKHSETKHMDEKSRTSSVFQQAKDAFFKIGPSLSKVNANNLSGFLVDFMRTYHQDIPLNKLFHLLFLGNYADPESVLTTASTGTGSSDLTESKLIAIQICRFILKKLQAPPNSKKSGAASDQSSVSPPINFHELARSFLAIKIIFSSVKKVQGSFSSHHTIPRSSVYKAYYIICQSTMRRSAGVSNLSSQSLILGQSPFGKLTNIVFPNLVTKRLGKRGNSKYNYVGITWDTAMVGEEILELLEHELPQIRDHFNKNSQSRDSDKHTDIVQPRKANIPTLVENNLAVSPLTTWKKPSHTFVDLSHKFPRINCSPRIWETTPNTVPRQSTWAQDHMERSLAALKLYHINLEPLIHNFNAGNFSDDHNDSLSNSVFRALVILHSASAPQKAYLHLYLIILVMIFPVVLASNTEVYPPAKTQFQYSVQSCIAKLESESANLFGVDETTLSTFIWILRKMVNVNDMTSCVIQAQYTEKILNEMTVQLEIALTKPPDEFADRSPLESLYIKSIITSMNSYNFQFAEDSSTASENNMIDSIDSLARLFKNTALKSKGEMSVLPQEARSQGLKHVSQDVPYQVFKIALRNFHEVTLTKPLILNLPMAVFTCIIHNFTNWVQCTSLNDFQKGDTEFAKECFKCCWVFSSMHHEYMRLISEVVALGETLSRNTDSE